MHSLRDPARFRELLSQIMTGAKLSQQDIASLAGVSRPQVSRWLSGDHRPGFDAVQQLASALQASYPQLAGDTVALVRAAGYSAAAPEPSRPPGRLETAGDVPGSGGEHRALPADPELRALVVGDQNLRAIWDVPGFSDAARAGMIGVALQWRAAAENAARAGAEDEAEEAGLEQAAPGNGAAASRAV
jgi:transcriptional regulator with XRE-family HTH domain